MYIFSLSKKMKFLDKLHMMGKTEKYTEIVAELR